MNIEINLNFFRKTACMYIFVNAFYDFSVDALLLIEYSIFKIMITLAFDWHTM